jgi:hypothetical protein
VNYADRTAMLKLFKALVGVVQVKKQRLATIGEYAELVRGICGGIIQYLDMPFSFFGHSMAP